MIVIYALGGLMLLTWATAIWASFQEDSERRVDHNTTFKPRQAA